VNRKVTLPKLTRRERKAAGALSQWMDESIPEAARTALAGLGITDPAALGEIGRALADHRAARQYEDARLIPQERREQAQATAAVILDLIERVPCLDPEIVARMNARRFETHRTGFALLWGAALPALADIHSLLLAAAGEIDKATPPPKRGRKAAVNPVFRAVLELLELRTELSKTIMRDHARAITLACGIKMPATDERSLRRLSTGQK
jgi:hypothetical protein